MLPFALTQVIGERLHMPATKLTASFLNLFLHRSYLKQRHSQLSASGLLKNKRYQLGIRKLRLLIHAPNKRGLNSYRT
jgi:hypothetical protein